MCYETDDDVVLFDPFLPQDGSFDPHGKNVRVLLTQGAHHRGTAEVVERYGASVWTPPRAVWRKIANPATTDELPAGIEALELIQGQAVGLELVVTDIVMPRMNGVELMQALSESQPDLPVILMSGYATTALAGMGIATPCSILAKPFSAESLLAEVDRCTRRPDGGSSAA